MAQGRDTRASSGSRITQRIPAISNTHINAFTTDVVGNYAGRMSNAMVDFYSNDKQRPYVTQRPAILLTQLASATVADTKGRGIHYWGAKGTQYFMNDDILYKTNYAGACSVQGGDTAITSGSGRVYFHEWSSANSDYLFIFDPENNAVYVINGAADTTVINITDRSGSGTLEGFSAGDAWDFDTLNSALGFGLCDGAVSLDGYLFIGTTSNARIYNSNNDDWINWTGLDFLTVERENDELMYIDKSHDNIVAFGERSIEVYYDNANETGSPLAPRKDIAYIEGITFGQAAWANGDDIYFMSHSSMGSVQLSVMQNFDIKHFSNTTFDGYQFQSKNTEDLTYVASGYSVGGHDFFILTILDAGTETTTYVYDVMSESWTEWSTSLNSNTAFPLMSYTFHDKVNITRPFGIMRNGDIMQCAYTLQPIDTILAGATANVDMEIVTDNFDAGTSSTKFMHNLYYVGSQTLAAQTLTVAWTDDNGATSVSGTIDTLKRTRINRMGKFVNRKFTFSYSGSEAIRFEGVDVNFTQGSV